MKKTILILLASLSANLGQGQVTWTDGGGNSLWSDPNNWSPGIPTPTSNVVVGTQPFENVLGLDTSYTIIQSLTFSSGLTATVEVAPAAFDDQLQINGAITNNSSFLQRFSLAVFAGADATWTGPLRFENAVVIGTRSITMDDSVAFTGYPLEFTINSTSSYGRFLGSGTTTFAGTVTINIDGSYTGVVGDLFDLTTTNFTGATLGTLPTLSGGLTWDTSDFISEGILRVVPEPQTITLLMGSLLGLAAIYRKRRA